MNPDPRRSCPFARLSSACEALEPRIVLDGDWSSLGDVFGSASGGYLTVTAIDLDGDPFAFEQVNRNSSGNDQWTLASLRATDDGVSNGTNFETLGRHSIALHDERLLIGAPNAENGAGAVAVFRRQELGVWVFETLLTAPGIDPGDGFGWSVDVHGTTAVIGTRIGNAAYVFENDGGWTLAATLSPTTGQDGRFGFSVATDGALIAVGAPGEETLDNDFAGTSGSVYVFGRDAGDWTLSQRIEPPQGAIDSEFGHSVAMQANTLAVGAWLDDDMGENSGSVFALGRHGGAWRIEAKLTPEETSPGARFGYDVAASGPRIAAVAIGSNDGSVLPWAQVFKRSGDDWSLEGTPAPGGGGDHGWRSVAFDGERLVLGSDTDDGKALVFRRQGNGAWQHETTLGPGDDGGALAVGFDVAAHAGVVVLGGLLAPGLNGEPVEVDAGAWVFNAPFDSDAPGASTRWIVRALGDLPGVGDPVSDLITWTDPKDGQTYAAAATDQGLILFTRSADRGTWTARNLTSEVPTGDHVVSDISVFGSRGNRVHIVGFNAQDELVVYRQNGTGSDGAFGWTMVNVTEQDLRPQGFATPRFVSGMVTFVTRWNALNIAGLDAEGDVQAVWIGPGMDRWRSDNLSTSSGAPPLSGQLAVFLTPWGGINLAGVDREGDLTVTWWVPGFGGDWAKSNFNDLFGGPAIDPSSVTAYTTSWGALNVLGRNDRGDLIVYWWTPVFKTPPENDYWRVTNLSTTLDTGPLASGTLSSLITADGQINLFGASEADDVVRFFWEPGDRWRVENLTHEAEPL